MARGVEGVEGVEGVWGGGAIIRGRRLIEGQRKYGLPLFLFITAKRLSPFVFLWLEKILIAGNAIGGSPPANQWGARRMETYDISD